MKFTKSLIKGNLIKRYKRFFVDVKVNKKILTAHCPNTGSMKGLLDQNNEVWLSKSDDPKRKLRFTLEIIKSKNKMIGVNTHLANKIVFEGLSKNLILEFINSKLIKPEVFFRKDTRFDFLVKKNNLKYFLEVKNVTLFRKGKISEFPDAVTSRGTKHLKVLIDAIKKGYKSYVLFLIQIEGIEYFKIAKDIDNEYYDNYLLAKKAGVKFIAYRCKVSSKEIKIEKKIKIINE